MKTLFIRSIALSLLALSTIAGSALADPPGHAKAHGWRKKNQERPIVLYQQPPYYRQKVVVLPSRQPAPVIVQRPVYPFFQERDYVEVRCENNNILGGVLGGVSGGLLADQFAHGRDRDLALIGSTLLGTLLGERVASPYENCTAQALEYARPNTQVVWRGNEGYQYVVLPGKIYRDRNGRECRNYQVKYDKRGHVKSVKGKACRDNNRWVYIR